MGLRELRLKRGLTQQQLADKVEGVNRARIAGYETGYYDLRNMSLDVALKLCDALRVSNPRKLLEDSSASPKENNAE